MNIARAIIEIGGWEKLGTVKLDSNVELNPVKKEQARWFSIRIGYNDRSRGFIQVSIVHKICLSGGGTHCYSIKDWMDYELR